jgi:hypothetical protein
LTAKHRRIASRAGETDTMRVLSDPTVGLVIEAATDRFTISELKTLMMRADVYQYGEKEGNKQEILRSRLRGARDYAETHSDADARLALLTFIRMLVERTVGDPETAWTWFGPLCEALLADGYELTWEMRTDRRGSPEASNFQILSTDAGPVPLAPEISALEAELRSRGYGQALNHYQQAISAFGRHEYEAANSQVRTTLEDVVTHLAEDHTGYLRAMRANTGTDAIRHMVRGGHISERDGGTMLIGLWQMIQTNGPHPGQTDPDEARWRMQMVTATARFLLRTFPAQP